MFLNGSFQVISEGRNEIKQTQEKLNSSLTTPIVDHEKKVLDNGSWMNEKKDVAKRFNVLPPIDDGKKVLNNGMAFTVD